MERIATIYFDDHGRIRIPIEAFGLNSIAEYIIDSNIYRPGHIVNITIRTVDEDNTVYMEEK